jgi:chorismate mutase/GNAT superfamily N-acetyltransferase
VEDAVGDLSVRRADADDSDVVAALHTAARTAAAPWMPPTLHTHDETRAWMAARLESTHEVWLAERDGDALGYMAISTGWLDDLYVHPDHQGAGVGATLLDLTKALMQDGFALWVFVSNIPARRFYERRGLFELLRTDGAANEEQAPDIQMAWPGTDPLAYLRARVDEVDAELAMLLERRATITAAVQRFKPVAGPAGRDQDREREIAERMAQHAPRLGADRLARIVHAVITESLDAAAGPDPSE